MFMRSVSSTTRLEASGYKRFGFQALELPGIQSLSLLLGWRGRTELGASQIGALNPGSPVDLSCLGILKYGQG